VTADFSVAPAQQSLGRALTPIETELASALVAIFGRGHHSIPEVAAELQQRGVRRPSGAMGAWSAAALEEELGDINAALDQAHGMRAAGASGETD
jgi:hypothetical protein